MQACRHKKGFTLVEILIAIAIMTVLIMIAVPAFMTSRASAQEKTCMANLRQMESAKGQFAMEEKLENGTDVSWDDIVPKFIKQKPKCPAKGTYAVNPVGDDPTCDFGGHDLP